jgi:hypothetical protein
MGTGHQHQHANAKISAACAEASHTHTNIDTDTNTNTNIHTHSRGQSILGSKTPVNSDASIAGSTRRSSSSSSSQSISVSESVADEMMAATAVSGGDMGSSGGGGGGGRTGCKRTGRWSACDVLCGQGWQYRRKGSRCSSDDRNEEMEKRRCHGSKPMVFCELKGKLHRNRVAVTVPPIGT